MFLETDDNAIFIALDSMNVMLLLMIYGKAREIFSWMILLFDNDTNNECISYLVVVILTMDGSLTPT